MQKSNKSIQKKKVRDIKEYFYYLNPLEKISEEYWEEEVWLQVPICVGSRLRLNAHKYLRDQLNYRFIIHQLGLTDSIKELTQRELWYYIEILLERNGMVMDTVYETKFLIEIERYCSRITDVSGYNYWGYVLDILKVKSKGTAMIYEDVNRAIALDKNTLIDYTETPFFLLICEKEGTLTGVLEELIKRGYKKEHFYCINAGGMATTNLIRLIREYKGIKNFHIFVLHDFDMSGLKILLNIMKHFACETIGVNPDFLEYCGYEFDNLCEGYKNKKGKKLEFVDNKTETGTRTALNELNIDIVEKERYKEWINTVVWKRIELNSITAHKIEKSPSESKVKDFVDYFEYILGNSKLNLLRIGDVKPSDTFSYSINKQGYNKDGMRFQNIGLPKIVSYTIAPDLDRITTYSPTFIWASYRAKERSIIIENEKLNEVIGRINDTIRLSSGIRDKLLDIEVNEEEYLEKRRDEILKAFRKDNPELFDVNWHSLHDKEKMARLNRQIEKHERMLRLKCALEYRKTKESLKNYKGSIKKEKPEEVILKKKIELAEDVINREGIRKERVKAYNIIIRNKLAETEEYKNAEDLVNGFGEFIDSIEERSSNKIIQLYTLKERMENDIKEWDNELDALINEEHE